MWPHRRSQGFFATLRVLKSEEPRIFSRENFAVPDRALMIKVRVSAEEREHIRERAETCGRATSTYMRELALGSKPRARPGRVERQAIYHLGRIGNNLNQLTRTANATGRIELTRRLDKLLNELLAAIGRLA